MLFYKIVLSDVVLDHMNTKFTKYTEIDSPAVEKSIEWLNIITFTEKYNRTARDTIFIEKISDQTVTAYAEFRRAPDMDFMTEYFKGCCIHYKTILIEECTWKDYSYSYRAAGIHAFHPKKEELPSMLGLKSLHQMLPNESVLKTVPKEELSRSVRELGSEDTLLQEIRRIFSRKAPVTVPGHPVHYLIMTPDMKSRETMTNIIVSALFYAGRLKGSRINQIELQPAAGSFTPEALDALFRLSEGSTLVIDYKQSLKEIADSYQEFPADLDSMMLKEVAEKVREYRETVLTIFRISSENPIILHKIRREISDVVFIDLKLDSLNKTRAQNFLSQMAEDKGITPDRELFMSLEEEKLYEKKELTQIFSSWHKMRLHKAYPEYCSFYNNSGKLSEQEPFPSEKISPALQRLEDMPGLTEAKRIIHQAIDYEKARRIMMDAGVSAGTLSRHMVFTGNPGTAKTTIARLYAEIMKDQKVLYSGKLVEVGRGDLVGKYVGWTAQKVQEVFRQAEGGVLFIDEAYSLIDDKEGLYGDEAINTIVQEMENHRENTVVIFAGYPGKMDSFIKKNPGLSSRINFWIHFEDYSLEELMEIADLIIREKGFILDSGASAKLNEIFRKAMKRDDFGNGRSVRNVVEQAILTHASRIANGRVSRDKKAIITLKACDFEENSLFSHLPEKKSMGFEKVS